MQFKVPQNIDLEDKLVGPLTLIQFLYVLGGGIIVYILFQYLYINYRILFFISAFPIGLLSLGLAFLKIQDQPLSHFISAGLQYILRPKLRFWKKGAPQQEILVVPPKVKKDHAILPKKKVEKSDLDQLAHVLDTRPISQEEQKYFGKITQGFEKLFQQENKPPTKTVPSQQKIAPQGGQVGNMGQTPTGNK